MFLCVMRKKKKNLERVSKGLKERDSPLIPGTVVHLKKLPKNISQLTKVLSNFYCMYTSKSCPAAFQKMTEHQIEHEQYEHLKRDLERALKGA